MSRSTVARPEVATHATTASPATPSTSTRPQMTEQDLDAQSPAADLVRVYLNGIGRTALLNAEQEVELAKQIEAGLYARHLLDSGKRMTAAKKRDLALIVREGEIARSHLLEANLRLVVSLASDTPAGDAAARSHPGGQPGSDPRDGSSTMPRASSSPPTPPGGSGRPSPAAWPIRSRPSACPSTSSSRSTRSPASSGTAPQLGREATDAEISNESGIPAEKIADLLDHSRDLVSLDMPWATTRRHRSAISSRMPRRRRRRTW